MGSPTPPDEFPEQVPAGPDQPGTRYVRRHGYFATHQDAAGGPPEPGPDALFTFDEGPAGHIAVYRGSPNRRSVRAARVGPVYALGSGADLAVPTGRVFLRLREGVPVTGRRAEIERAGYRIEAVPPYAPHAAWLRAGSVAAGLTGIEALRAVPEVQGVEPEMLMRRQPK